MSEGPLVLITGGTGLVGKGLCETAPARYRLVSAHLHPYAVEAGNATQVVADVRRPDDVDRLFAAYRFDTVVHAAGIASVDYAERHSDEARQSNLGGTENLIAACRRSGCRFVYVSTNAVFDGTRAPYGESDPVAPINTYGRIKAECEKHVAATLEQYTIVRPILMYGWNHPTGRVNPVTWLLAKLTQGERVRIVDDVYENPLYNVQCGEAIWQVVTKTLTGIVHLAGAEIVNRYELALKVANVFGVDASLIEPVGSAAFPDIAPRPRNTSLVTTRMEADLGVRPLAIDAGLRLMRAQRMQAVGD